MGKKLDGDAVLEMARIIGGHRAIREEGQVGTRCKHIDCKGLVMLTLNDQYRHIAVILEADGFGDKKKAKKEAFEEAASALDEHVVKDGEGSFVFPGENLQDEFYRADENSVSASDFLRVKSAELYPTIEDYNYKDD